LAATEIATEPLPLPLVLEEIVIHGAPAVALQEQSLSVDTFTLTLPPVWLNDALPGWSV
jgi:hypothetical protein